MQYPKLLLLDTDVYTSSLIIDDLRKRNIVDIDHVINPLNVPDKLQTTQPDVVIFNYHSEFADSLIICNTIKLICPESAIIAIVSRGPALKAARALTKQSSSIDVIIEKPLSDERFYTVVEDLLKLKSAAREIQSRAEKLSQLIPEAALNALDDDNNEAKLFEAAVIFTDIRGSSELIQVMPPHVFFNKLNQLLTAQANLVKLYGGNVIKFTGDGLMAIFRGSGRSYVALRCAFELAKDSKNQQLACGVGVSEGLVLAGMIGDSHHLRQRRQYDVIGVNVHLASRLCSIANGGEVVAMKCLTNISRVTNPPPKDIGAVFVKGFASKIDCIAFDLN